MRHVLYVAWGFPPHRGPGAYRPLATVNELARRGHHVTVLTADLDTFDIVYGADYSLLEQLDPRVDVLRVPFRPVLQDPFVERWSSTRVANPSVWREATIHSLSSAIPDPTYASWLSPALAAVVELHERTAVDLTIATGNPYVDFAVAWSLYANEDVPFVLDDRDSWLHDVYTGELQPEFEAVRAWLTPAFEAAAQLWFVNPPIAAAYAAEFPEAADRIHVVENGWDPAFLGHRDELAHTGSRQLTAAFIGTLSPGLPLRTLAEAWRIARLASPSLADGKFRLIGQLGYSGTATDEQKAIRDEYAGDGLELAGRIPKAEVAQAYADADLLIFAKEGGGLVTSGKIYEYLASGLPIASLIDPDHDARRVLDGYPRWHDASEQSAEALARALMAAAEDALNEDHDRIAAALGFATGFQREVILGRALTALEQELGWR